MLSRTTFCDRFGGGDPLAKSQAANGNLAKQACAATCSARHWSASAPLACRWVGCGLILPMTRDWSDRDDKPVGPASPAGALAAESLTVRPAADGSAHRAADPRRSRHGLCAACGRFQVGQPAAGAVREPRARLPNYPCRPFTCWYRCCRMLRADRSVRSPGSGGGCFGGSEIANGGARWYRSQIRSPNP